MGTHPSAHVPHEMRPRTVTFRLPVYAFGPQGRVRGNHPADELSGHHAPLDSFTCGRTWMCSAVAFSIPTQSPSGGMQPPPHPPVLRHPGVPTAASKLPRFACSPCHVKWPTYELLPKMNPRRPLDGAPHATIIVWLIPAPTSLAPSGSCTEVFW